MVALAHALSLIRDDGGPHLLPAEEIDQLAAQRGVVFRDTALTPGNTLRLFVRQVAHGNVALTDPSGTVAFADPFSGFGMLVIVDHGDQIFTLYGHLGSAAVHKGDRVDATTTVGLAGRNPSGNPSLYFELRVDGKAVDPLQWLKR